MAQRAIIQENARSFVTYPFSDPDPVARPGRFYPYFRFDGYTKQGKPQNWNVVELENDYIRLAITPQIGGKVWGAYEKSSQFPFIYFNHVVKFRDVAMRGAWTSGGIEFNFGDIGHAPTTSTPVDYVTRTNVDGSVSCFIGATDWSDRTTWRVEIRLASRPKRILQPAPGGRTIHLWNSRIIIGRTLVLSRPVIWKLSSLGQIT